MRPDTPARGDTAFGAPDRPRATSELSVDSIVGRYRNHYPAQLLEFGSDVQGDVDPQVVDAAKRRTALDFGYVELDAWSDLVAELTEAQRLELAERIEQSNREFARQLHRGDASQPR